MLRKFTMQRSEKPLPQLPQTEKSPAPVPLESQQCSSLNQQTTHLEQQNETLRYALRKASERITRLQQQMTEYQRYVTRLQQQMTEHQRYITRQHENFARVTRKVHSAYQEYYSAVENNKSEISSMGVDLMSEPVQTCAAFSDSEEDLI